MIKIINRITYIFIFLSTLLSDTFTVKKNITSLLNTTDIITINDNIIISTNGGIYKYEIEDNQYTVLNQNLFTYNILNMNVINDNLFLSSGANGMIQVLNSNLDFVEKIDYPLFDNILKVPMSPEQQEIYDVIERHVLDNDANRRKIQAYSNWEDNMTYAIMHISKKLKKERAYLYKLSLLHYLFWK